MQQHTLLIASADAARRTYLATQFDADGHTVYAADSAASTIAKLSKYAVDGARRSRAQSTGHGSPATGRPSASALHVGASHDAHPTRAVVTPHHRQRIRQHSAEKHAAASPPARSRRSRCPAPETGFDTGIVGVMGGPSGEVSTRHALMSGTREIIAGHAHELDRRR
jgi:hypothetical protein